MNSLSWVTQGGARVFVEVVSGACGVTFVLTSCGKGIQEQEPGWEYFCWKADLKLAVASKKRPVVHVCESKSNSRLHQPRRGRANLVAQLCSGLESSGSQEGAFTQSEAFIPCVLGLLCHFPMAHSRPSTPALGTAGLMIPAFRNSTLPGHLWGNPVGLVGTG